MLNEDIRLEADKFESLQEVLKRYNKQSGNAGTGTNNKNDISITGSYGGGGSSTTGSMLHKTAPVSAGHLAGWNNNTKVGVETATTVTSASGTGSRANKSQRSTSTRGNVSRSSAKGSESRVRTGGVHYGVTTAGKENNIKAGRSTDTGATRATAHPAYSSPNSSFDKRNNYLEDDALEHNNSMFDTDEEEEDRTYATTISGNSSGRYGHNNTQSTRYHSSDNSDINTSPKKNQPYISHLTMNEDDNNDNDINSENLAEELNNIYG